MVTFRKILGPTIEVAKKNVKSVLTGPRETRDGQEEGYIPPEPAETTPVRHAVGPTDNSI